jgi:multiple sugar transport system permease protein
MNKEKLYPIIYHLIIISVGFIMIYPLLWMVAGSFKTLDTALDPSLIPNKLNFENYVQGWQGFGDLTFATFFKNSFIIATVSTIGQIFLSALAAYGFTRLEFPGRKILFGIMIATLLLPRTILRIPQYILFNEIGWIDSFKPIILPRFFPRPFFVFMIVQFLRGISKELDRAAMVDGCTRYGVFFRVLLPTLKPALITSAIFSFYWAWNDFMTPLLYIQSTELYPVSLALQLFSDPNSVTNWGAMFAMGTLSILPVFIIFLFFQRYIVEGVSTSGLKQ